MTCARARPSSTMTRRVSAAETLKRLGRRGGAHGGEGISVVGCDQALLVRKERAMSP
jgi:hypothetical protein